MINATLEHSVAKVKGCSSNVNEQRVKNDAIWSAVIPLSGRGGLGSIMMS